MRRKYSKQTKLSAVLAYLKGEGGLRATAETHSVDVSALRKWVADYRQHGMAAFQDRNVVRRQYSPEFKVSVLHRVYEDGLSYRQAGALFDIRRFTAIAEWAQRYEEGGIEALTDRRRKQCERHKAQSRTPADPQPAGGDIRTRGQLLAELHRLRTENAYLKKLDALVLANKQSALHKRHK